MTVGLFKPFTIKEDTVLLRCLDHNMTEEMVWQAACAISAKIERKPIVCIQRAFQLGIIHYKENAKWLLSHRENGWRSDEIDLLVNNPSVQRDLLARILKRSKQSVSKQCFEMRLNNGGLLYNWTEDEKNYLVQCFDSTSMRVLKKELGRSAVDVRHMMVSMGLFKSTTSAQFTGRPPKNLFPIVTQ